MNVLIEKLCKYLLLNEIIKEEDISLYEYGLYQLFFYIIEYGCLTLIAIIIGMFKPFIIFTISIMIIRKNAGGIHSESHLMCFVITSMIFFIVLEIIKIFDATNIMRIVHIPLIISILFIIILAPVDTPNKRLSSIENKIYRRRAIIALLLDLSVLIVSLIFNRLIIAETISFSIIISSSLVVLGKIKLIKLKD